MFCFVGGPESEKIQQQQQSSDEGICSCALSTSNSQPSSSCVRLLRECCPTIEKKQFFCFSK
jgi:hypothetical protein